jgi:micrococcal nuclease
MSRRRTASSVGLSLLAFLVGALLVYGGLYRNTSQATTASGTYHVTHVDDGDTVVVDWNGQKRTIRLIGMDTPEVVDPRKPVQCYGREASAEGHRLLENQNVRIETDPAVGELDKYGRTLGYVFLPDGTLYNQLMIANGFAHEYTYNKQYYKYQAQFKAAEAEAKVAAKGFWSPATCNGNTTQPAAVQ